MSPTKTTPKQTLKNPVEYYDRHGVLNHLVEEPIGIALEEELRDQISSGERKRHLKTISLKLDPAQIIALRKIAVMKSVPYQTLIRELLATGIRRELEHLHA